MANLSLSELDRERRHQAAVDAGFAQRSEMVSRKLAAIHAVFRALASGEELDQALQRALAACFAARGFSLVALYLQHATGPRVLSCGAPQIDDAELVAFFGEPGVLDEAIEQNSVVAIAATGPSRELHSRILARVGAASALVAPVVHGTRAFGALLMTTERLDLATSDRREFAETVAGLFAQALAACEADRRRAEHERASADHAARLRAVLDCVSDAVVVADEQGRLTHWNMAATRLFGIDPTAEPRQVWCNQQLFEPDRVTPIPSHGEPLIRALGGETLERIDFFTRSDEASDGRCLSVTARPFGDGLHSIRGAVSASREATRERSLEAELIASERMASMGMLVTGVAHEINNPLAATIANLELADDTVAKLDRSDHVSTLSELITDARCGVDRVREIIRDLRIFARRDAALPGAVDVADVLDSSIRMAWHEIRHRAQLERDYAASLDKVRGTDSRLGQVFLNLLVNAAQAITAGNAENNVIRITTRSEGPGRVAIEISDTGCGMSPECLQQLFSPFFTTKPKGNGMGVGLAICRRIIADFDGSIEADSSPGKGTTMRIVLPCAVTPSVAPQKAQHRRTSQRCGRVLIVDDDPLIGEAIRRLLATRHDVVIAAHARDGLRRLQRGESYDVILCDLMMPQMSGPEFHRELQSFDHTHAERIVFLTAGAMTRASRNFLDAVDNQRLEKPFDVRHLVAIVDSWVDQKVRS